MTRMFRIALAAASAATLATPALAQQPSDTQAEAAQASTLEPSQLRELDDVMVPRLGVRVGKLERMELRGPDGEEVGEVEEILVDPENRIVAVVIELDRFLGFGEREVVVGLDQLAVDSDREDLTTTLTREQLNSLPEWDD